MSNNTFNIYYNIIERNIININDLKVDFVKNYIKESNIFDNNHHYNYASIPNTNNVYPKVEFNRRDSNDYMKLKNKDKWLYEKNGKLFFDKIRKEDFCCRQPLVLWFNYVRDVKFKQMVFFVYISKKK